MGETGIALGYERCAIAEGKMDGKLIGKVLGYFSHPGEREARSSSSAYLRRSDARLYGRMERQRARTCRHSGAGVREREVQSLRANETRCRSRWIRRSRIEGLNRYVVEGLRFKTYDCSQITDGYAALILATEEGLAKLGAAKSECVEIAGWGRRPTRSGRRAATCCGRPARIARCRLRNAMAGAGPADVNVAEVHDWFQRDGSDRYGSDREDRGRQGRPILGGRQAASDGECGINTSGGLIAKGHPIGATGIAMIGWSALQLQAKRRLKSRCRTRDSPRRSISEAPSAPPFALCFGRDHASGKSVVPGGRGSPRGSLLPITKRSLRSCCHTSAGGQSRWSDTTAASRGKAFFQKDVSKGFRNGLERVEVPRRRGQCTHPLACDARSLLWMANRTALRRMCGRRGRRTCISPISASSTWTRRRNSRTCCAPRRSVARPSARSGLTSWLKTSGSKGFHIVVPLDGTLSTGDVAGFAHAVGTVMVRRDPEHLTQEFAKVDRGAGSCRHGAKRIQRDVRGAYAVRRRRRAGVGAVHVGGTRARRGGSARVHAADDGGAGREGGGVVGEMVGQGSRCRGRWNCCGGCKFNARGASRRRRCLSRPWFRRRAFAESRDRGTNR